MTATLNQFPRFAARIFFGLACLWLAACDTLPAVGSGGPQIDASRPVAVALLVPGGSGQATENTLARSLENAARLAISDLQGASIDLRVYQTAGRPGQASAMAIKAADDGAKIILGPVFASEAAAVGVAAGPRNLNVLAFSNNTDIAGGNVFVLGNTFENTANRLVSYSVRRGKRNIMIVSGNDVAEQQGRNAIAAASARNGASIVAEGSYPLSQSGIVSAAPGIASRAKSSGAQALFMTAGTAGALPILSQILSENGVTSATHQLVGLQRWDVPAAALELPGLQGGWFAIPSPTLQQQFRNRYTQAYGSAPHPIAGLAYDGIAAIGALISGGRSNALTRAGLTQGSGFVGVNGVFRLRPDGTNERGLAVAEIRNRQVIVIDPAPRSFGGAGF